MHIFPVSNDVITDFQKPISAYHRQVSSQATSGNYQLLGPNEDYDKDKDKDKDLGTLKSESSSSITSLSSQKKPYSEYYLDFNISDVLGEISLNLLKWSEVDKSNSYVYVSEIKTILREKREYFQNNKSAQLMFSGIDLLFRNNKWDSVESNKIKHLSTILSSFSKKNKLESEDVKKFITTIKSSRMSFLAEGLTDEQAQEEAEALKKKFSS